MTVAALPCTSMATTLSVAQLRAGLDDYLARAASGERILVRNPDGRTVALVPSRCR